MMPLLNLYDLLSKPTPWLPPTQHVEEGVATTLLAIRAIGEFSSVSHHADGDEAMRLQDELDTRPSWKNAIFGEFPGILDFDPDSPPASKEPDFVLLHNARLALCEKLLFGVKMIPGDQGRKEYLIAQRDLRELFFLRNQRVLYMCQDILPEPKKFFIEKEKWLMRLLPGTKSRFDFEALLHLPAIQMLNYGPQLENAAEALHFSIHPLYRGNNQTSSAIYHLLQHNSQQLARPEVCNRMTRQCSMLMELEMQARRCLRKKLSLPLHERLAKTISLISIADIFSLQEARDLVSFLILCAEMGMLPELSTVKLWNGVYKIFTPSPTPAVCLSDRERAAQLRHLLHEARK